MNYLDELYLAYGSNVSKTEMKSRCPQGKFIGLGKLKDTNLAFKGLSRGYLTTFEESGADTDVAAYQITESDKCMIDYYEGYPSFYHIKHTEIEINGKTYKAFYYEMNEYASALAKDGRTYQYETKYEYPDMSYIVRCKNGYKEVGMDVFQLSCALEDLAKCIWE